jgi:hypothetical protein
VAKIKRQQEILQRKEQDSKTIDKLLDVLCGRLMSVDVSQRRKAVDRIHAETTPEVRVLIIDRLIELLKGRNDATSSCASDFLVHFGKIALPSLSHKLIDSPDSRMVQRIANVLGTIGAKALPYSQVDIQMNLEIRLARTRNIDVAKAIMEAHEKIRPGSAALIALTARKI